METPSQNTKTSKQHSLISKVRVIVRLRPSSTNPITNISLLKPSDQNLRNEVIVHLQDQLTSRNECFELDSFFGQESSVSEIFEKEVTPLISWVFNGFNATVFTYGGSGSGKTFTMQGNDELPGLMPLSMSMVLEMCEKSGSFAEISYYEVYMDRCYDLLEPKGQEICLLEDKDGHVHLKGLSRIRVSSISHGVLVIIVSSPSTDGFGPVVKGKLNMIDFASFVSVRNPVSKSGHEENRNSVVEGILLQESSKINKSLFALSNVIYALNNNESRVPYRESKLTRILQDSLGGTSRALMVACLNPGEYQESINTVSLASRSRHITNYVSSARKEETPTVKINKEAKLHPRSECKGETKCSQRIRGYGTPSFSKTPLSTRLTKEQGSCRSNKKVRDTTVKSLANMNKRNLFKSGAPVESSLEEMHLDNVEESKDCSNVTQETGVKACLPDESLNEENLSCTPSSNSVGEKSTLRKVLSPINNNSKLKFYDNMTFEGHVNIIDPKTPKTPYILTYDSDRPQDSSSLLEPITPLERYSIRSSHLKSSLVREYLEFLNSASKEELVKLKGVGHKRAEHILSLREASPLESKWLLQLYDVEKIGLSSKQVSWLFMSSYSMFYE
ncbi:hypothetical protein IFM89_036602 [Coptis chinensis]|uniref:Kinesin motor domain-containing protein n=1 Tax=Coptis chinensis TaxID=261450 RepID=A0A835LPY5_9MAGN|nr:hypothetical protein IFM89_036602 [Coptis chinensis]